MIIDFHTHILPGMDDGSKDVKESIAMLQAEKEAGVDRVVFTPHFYASQNGPEEFLQRRREAWLALMPHMYQGLPKVSFGAEVQYFEGICHAEELSMLRIAGTEYLLLEMPFHRWDDRMVENVLELNMQPDTTVVLAHIERYFSFAKSSMLNTLWTNGVKIQMNVSAFDKRQTRKQALAMLKAGQVHVLGSDSHNMESRKPNWNALPENVKQLLEESEEYKAICETFQNISI